MHYTHSDVCKGKAESNIVLEETKDEKPREELQSNTVKPTTTFIETNPVEVVKELRTVDLSENEMKDVLLKKAKTVQNKKKIEKTTKIQKSFTWKIKF